jgi:FKBP-type peptidyl-prolyl cis-trans isomerase FkpA
MSEITRVPLQPVGKGSLTRIWIGVILALLIGATAAWARAIRASSSKPSRRAPARRRRWAMSCSVDDVGHLATGKEFDKGEKVAMPVEGVIPGFSKGLQKMQRGGKYKLVIPRPPMAYGPAEPKNPSTGEVVIPANSDLTFDVELLDFKSAAEIEQRRQMLQQLQQQMGSAPEGAAESMPQPDRYQSPGRSVLHCAASLSAERKYPHVRRHRHGGQDRLAGPHQGDR